MPVHFPLLIDGGFSYVLEEQGVDLNPKIWYANLLESNPETIIDVHLAYLNSGAECIITSSYQASVPGFMALGYDRGAAEKFIIQTSQLAEQAVNRFMASGDHDKKPMIAASIGPYGAYLADGSEYVGNYGVSDEILREFHLERINILDETGADFFACETIPSFQEARVLADILKGTKKSAWISFSCKDVEHINDGTHIGKCASLFADHPNVFAVGVNCTAPAYISGLIKTIKAESGGKKIIVYPNSGESYHAESKSWMGLSDPEAFVAMTDEWLKLGADMVGGCCRIGPGHISNMSDMIHKN